MLLSFLAVLHFSLHIKPYSLTERLRHVHVCWRQDDIKAAFGQGVHTASAHTHTFVHSEIMLELQDGRGNVTLKNSQNLVK